MIGAIIGDIAGSRFEWHNHKSKDFEFFTSGCHFTDDSVMTIAVAKAIMESRNFYGEEVNLPENTVKWMQKIGRHYPHCGYGGNFYQWIFSDNPKPYGSYGNGAAMRVSAAGDIADSLDEAQQIARDVTEVTHNHTESVKAAEAVASAIFLARHQNSKEEIRQYIRDNYYWIDFTLDEIRRDYKFDVSCQGSVPQALEAFFESDGFEDAIRNAISIGGDSDTIAAITGGIAEAYYGVPAWMADKAIGKFNYHMREIIQDWYINGHVHRKSAV